MRDAKASPPGRDSSRSNGYFLGRQDNDVQSHDVDDGQEFTEMSTQDARRSVVPRRVTSARERAKNGYVQSHDVQQNKPVVDMCATQAPVQDREQGYEPEGLGPAADAGERFAFGKNWRAFLSVLNDERIAVAEESLRGMLEMDSLAGRSWLDIGSGSGLFSLAAARLGASPIHSFDYDPDSVACTRELKRRYQPAAAWTIERGSALDGGYLESLGRFDIVYAWGVLHHTGNLWRALELVRRRVKPGGRLFIAIYNDQGLISRAWTLVKRTYNRGRLGRMLMTGCFVPYFAGRGLASDLIHLRNPAARYRQYQKQRGMSVVHDWRDWLGGYPFEVARPDEVVRFCQARGLTAVKVKTCGRSLGNNEFVFAKPA